MPEAEKTLGMQQLQADDLRRANSRMANTCPPEQGEVTLAGELPFEFHGKGLCPSEPGAANVVDPRFTQGLLGDEKGRRVAVCQKCSVEREAIEALAHRIVATDVGDAHSRFDRNTFIQSQWRATGTRPAPSHTECNCERV